MPLSIDHVLGLMVEKQASDAYLTVDAPASLRVSDRIEAIGDSLLTDEDIRVALGAILSDEQWQEFEHDYELNTSINWNNRARFRINVFRQQQQPGIVIRKINTDIPTLEELSLPPVFGELIMKKRGMVLVVGTTGSGKSTSLAAMLGHRNRKGSGHIITIEDPIEYVHRHGKCLFTQREVGIDTTSFRAALKNALRQRPDVVLLGEIRDAEVMEQALAFSESGHLCVATLHANSAAQTIERIVDMFPEERHQQIRRGLAENLQGIVAQRLLPNKANGRSLALEVMLRQGSVPGLIEEGEISQLKEIMSKSRGQGMVTFDQSILDLFTAGEITEEVALAESDNPTNLALTIRQHQASQAQTGAGHLNAGASFHIRDANG